MTAGHVRLGQGTPPTVPLGEGALYFDAADQQLYAIDAAGVTVGPLGGGGGGGGVTAANVVYVQTPANGGNNGTGVRGDSSKPFATLAAALGAALNGDIVSLGAGSFTGPGDLNTANPSLNSITIVGQGQKDTLIVSPGAELFITDYATNNVVWQKFVLARVGLVGSGLANILTADGSGAPSATFFPRSASTGFALFDVDLSQGGTNGLAVGACGSVRLERVYQRDNSQAVSLFVINVANAEVRDCAFSQILDAINFSSPWAPPIPSPGSVYERVTVETVFLGAQTQSRWVDSSVTVEVKDDKLSVGGAPLQGPVVEFQGGSIVSIDLGATSFTKIPDDGTANMLFAFADVRIVNVAAEVKAPAVNRQTVRLVGCTVSGTATALDGIDLDAATSTFAQPTASALVTVGSGTIRPRFFDLPITPTLAGITLVNFGFVLPSPLPAYVVALESDNVLDGNIAVTLKATNSLLAVAASGGNGNVTGVVYLR